MELNKKKFYRDLHKNFMLHEFGKDGAEMTSDFEERAIKHYASDPIFRIEIDGFCAGVMSLLYKYTIEPPVYLDHDRGMMVCPEHGGFGFPSDCRDCPVESYDKEKVIDKRIGLDG